METQAYILSIRLFILFSTTMFLWGCAKKEEIKPDLKPIKIQTNAVGNVSSERATLNAEVLYLNDEKIIDFGFIIKTSGINGPEKKVSLGSQTAPGIISHVFQPTEGFGLGLSFHYTFYLTTEVKTYLGEYHSFSVKDFWVDQEETIPVTLGDILVLSGNFKQITDDLIVKINQFSDNNQLEIVGKTETTLSIKIPDNLGYHEQTFDLYIGRREQPGRQSYLDHSLARIMLLGKIDFLIDGPQYLTEALQMKPYGIEWSNRNFSILIGDKKTQYFNNTIPIGQLGLRGIRHRLGYYNGVDTIISDKELVFISPQPNEIKIANGPILHPGELMKVETPQMWKYFEQVHPLTIRVNDKKSDVFYDSETSFKASTPDLSNGIYKVTIESPIYGNIVLNKSIEIQSIKAQILEKKSNYYYNEEIQINGNFRQGVDYVAQIDDYELYRGRAKNGIIAFPLSQANFGSQKLQIGFVDDGWYPIFGNAEENMNIAGSKIDNFYPKQGYSGDIITLTGKGFLPHSTSVFIADSEATIIFTSETELKFILPTTVRKGKFPIELDYFIYKGRVISDQTFEIK